jgi:hypothetical protein
MDISPVRQGVLEIKRLAAEASQAMQQAMQAGQARGTQTVVSHREAPGAIPVGSGAGVDRAAVAAAKLATEQNKAAVAAQRLATEEQRTAVAAANVERAETQAASAALRLSQQQDKANASASKGKGSFGQMAEGIRGIQSLLGAAGIGIGVNALVQGGIDAGQYSVGVRQTEGVLRQLSGTQARYNELTKIAADNQRLFGGSLADNYAPLTGVLSLANQTGASLSQLNRTTQLLLAKAPGKSAGDAFFGLGEFLSGTGAEAALSIADQFNLSKAAVAGLAKEGVSAQDRLAGLTKLLNDQGVSSDTLTARLTDQAVAYNEAGAKVDALKLKIGDLIAAGFTPAARGLTLVLNVVEQGVDRNTKAGGTDAATYTPAIQASYDRLTGSVRAYADAQIAAGVSMGQAVTQAYQLGEAGAASALAAQQATAAQQARAEATRIAGAADDETRSALGALQVAQEAATVASTSDALTKANAAAQADILKIKNTELEVAYTRAAAGSDTAAVAAAKLAAIYGQAQYPALLAIISALREKATLEGAKTGEGLLGGLGDSMKRNTERADALSAAQLRYTEATESSAQRVARLRSELTHLTRGSAAYVDQQTKIRQAEQQLAAERTRSGTAADKLVTKEASAANAEAVALRDAQRRIESMTQDHYDKLQRMGEDYTLSQSRKDEDYQEKRQRLLAEGNLKEAATLKADYEKEKRRDAEDRAIALRRENEQAAQQIADAQEQAGIKAGDRERKRRISGVALAGDGGAAAIDAANTRQAQADATLASTAMQRPTGGLLRIEFAPISLVADGATLASVVYPAIETQLDAFLANEIATIRVTAPPGGGQGGGVGGPRP